MSIITTRESTEQINVEQYVSTLPYEMMNFKENFFSNIVNNENIKRIFKGTETALLTKEEIKKILEDHRNTFAQTKNKDIKYDTNHNDSSLNVNIIKKEIFNYLLNYRFFELYSSTDEIATAKVALKTMTKDDIAARKATLKNIARKSTAEQTELDNLEKNEQLASNRTLYILPKISSTTNQSSNLNMNIVGSYKPYYSNLFNSSNENIFFLSVFSLNNEDIDTFKSRMDQEIIELSEKIKSKGKDDRFAYNKIIYLINNPTDKLFYTDFFKRTLKKEFITELNTKLKNFFVSRIGNQTLRLNTTPYYNDIEKLKSDSIIRNLRNVFNLPIFTDNLFKSSVQLLVDSIKNCYLSYTDAKFRKSLSENVNINTFNIYTRLENLDDAEPMNTIVAANDYYYIFLENGHDPRVGKFQVSNEAKNQYFFVVDRNKGVFKKWKTALDASGNMKTFGVDQSTWSEEYKKYKNIYNPGTAASLQDNPDDNAQDDIEPENQEKQDRDDNRILVQVRYNYGQIQFKNIQDKINTPFNGVIKFHMIARPYELYDWFKFNMIDRTFDRNKSEINYYPDTVFDRESLTAFLKSENKWTEKTRLPLEFLKLNVDISQLKKYSDYIYDNFKKNVNLNLNDTTFEEKIKKGIIDIIFEKNGLIYVKTTNIIAEKEKEKADADNFKIINCKYVTINKKSIEPDITHYFNKNSKEERNHLRDANKNIKELTNVCNQDKKTGGLAILQITRDVIGDSTQLMISAECKKRSRRIKNKVQQAFNYIFQGGKTFTRNARSKRSRKYYRT
jgi:hypothetical protein